MVNTGQSSIRAKLVTFGKMWFGVNGIIAALFFIHFLMSSAASVNNKKNVLLIIIDDYRPEMGVYAKDISNQYFAGIKTPHMDKLASKSFVAKNAFVQQAVCGPSRASFLTSRRPDTTKVTSIGPSYLKTGGPFASLPQYFKEHGYLTAGVGKIFHAKDETRMHRTAWTEEFFSPKNMYKREDKYSWSSISSKSRAENLLMDEQIADSTVKTLRKLSKRNRPFMLAVGFHKPHLSWDFPSEMRNEYPIEKINLPSNPYAPIDMPSIAWSSWLELRRKKDIAATRCSGAVNETLPNGMTKTLRRAYYSCVTYIDELVGSITTALKDSGIEENTIVALIGDHGYLLGEHGGWNKHSNFGLAVRAPFLIRVPGHTDKGILSEEIVEFVDLFPTLVEAAGLGQIDLCPLNSSNIKVCREGSSLMPLIREEDNIAWKKAAFSWYPRHSQNYMFMGYAVHSLKYRYTEWVRFDEKTFKPDWNEVKGKELYDLTEDPEENRNVVEYPEYKDIVQSLAKQLREGWRSVLP